MYYANRDYYKEMVPELQPIVYDKDWLMAHPEVTEVCQTLRKSERKEWRRSTEDEISSAMCYSREKEWVAIGVKKVPPLDIPLSEDSQYRAKGAINIYLSEKEIERIIAGKMTFRQSYHMGMEELCPALKLAREMIEEVLPVDLPVETIKMYYCDDHSALINANMGGSDSEKAKCQLYNYLDKKGPPMKDGIKKQTVWKVY